MKKNLGFIYILFGVIIIITLLTVLLLNKQKTSNPIELVDLPAGADVATFAPGCFWCMEAIMQEQEGVYEVVSGYAGGTEVNPTYKDVYSEQTGHRESVQVFYNPNVITYEQLLDIFWMNIDPTDSGGQFFDRGFSYTTAIFYHDKKQMELAIASFENLESSNIFEEKIVTEILPYTTFYMAEEYHQDFYKKSSTRYNVYNTASGRDEFKKSIWKAIESGEK